MDANHNAPDGRARGSAASWPDILTGERARIETRRAWIDRRISESHDDGRADIGNPANTAHSDHVANADRSNYAIVGPRPKDIVGLALSGGGIRSATFSAGVLSSLSRLGLMHRIDYLSTVSGGGYAGAFYCSLFVPEELRGSLPATKLAACVADDHARKLGGAPLDSNTGRLSLGQLRQAGNYLTPAGATDTLFAAIVALRNWVAVTLVSGLAVLSILLAINLVRAGVQSTAEPFKTATAPTRWISAVISHPPAAMICLDEKLKPDKQATCLGERLVIATDSFGSSYLWLLSLALIPLWLLPASWAYWMVPTGTRERFPYRHYMNLMIATAAISAILLFAIWWVEGRGETASTALLMPEIIGSALGIIFYIGARLRVRKDAAGIRYNHIIEGADSDAPRVARENHIRAKISRWLYRGVIVWACLCGLALVDDLGRYVYLFAMSQDGATARDTLWPSAAASALIAGMIPILRWLLAQGQSIRLLDVSKFWPAVRRSFHALALLVALMLLMALMTFWSAIAYELVWHHQRFKVDGPLVRFSAWFTHPISGPALVTASVVLFTLLTGKANGFLNQSSLASFYAARLRKAYLGATNARSCNDPDSEHPLDDIHLSGYYHASVWGPIHLINVTVNETTSKSSNIIQRDRKGKPLTISPEGFIVSLGTPTDPPVGYAFKDGEELSLSTWIAISGAAISTGMGQNTTLGQSLLASLVNLRLGYWWESPVAIPARGGSHVVGKAIGWCADHLDDLVQSYFLREARAKYEGTHTNRWYLTDGGHYENTGVYELARRRVGLIIACDNGADPAYEFSDLVNLIRKLRIDFDADTIFLGSVELDKQLGTDNSLRSAFGTLEQISHSDGAAGESAGPYAALARIHYLGVADRKAGTPPSTLLLIKPRLGTTETPDLVRYKAKSSAFPQHPTTDQTFDEPQWESYFRLGQIISDTVFEKRTRDTYTDASHQAVRENQRPANWWPSALERLPEAAGKDTPIVSAVSTDQ